jgi:hypothetical protein
MYELMQLFFQIAIFQKGPQDVPASNALLKLLLPVYIAVNYLILLINGASGTAFLQIAVDFGLIVGFSWPLLYFASKSARFPQTLSAMVGTDTVISFMALPAIATLNSHANDVAYFAMLGLVLWHWLVSGHILRHALDRSLFFGLGLALLYMMLSSRIMAALFPEIAGISD